jgi:hypothetical protein
MSIGRIIVMNGWAAPHCAKYPHFWFKVGFDKYRKDAKVIGVDKLPYINLLGFHILYQRPLPRDYQF